ncbi:hypothetical protein LX83_003733 [Goodfellowiella coeruleoviolacea]|uniref:Uncharacterized protein n=1 Tax=Goodfellowiella coeruleoviolacea TaxID=334858 RepID=A0AAE3GER0_9PSEU|nr:hypothetical protein [Goodfellowiella coeruleoviolacea]
MCLRRSYRHYDDAYKEWLVWLNSRWGHFNERVGRTRMPRWCHCGAWHLVVTRLPLSKDQR